MPETAGTAESAERAESLERTVRRLGDELAATRAALEASEAELLRLRESRSAEMSRLERQVYWLERFGVDLDALMARRPVRAAFTVLRALVRAFRKLAKRR